MPTGKTATVTITLRLGAEPIEGIFERTGADAHGFAGWLELTSLLRAAAETPDDRTDPPPAIQGHTANGS